MERKSRWTHRQFSDARCVSVFHCCREALTITPKSAHCHAISDAMLQLHPALVFNIAGTRRVYLWLPWSHGESVLWEVGMARSVLLTAELPQRTQRAAALLAQLACDEKEQFYVLYNLAFIWKCRLKLCDRQSLWWCVYILERAFFAVYLRHPYWD